VLAFLYVSQRRAIGIVRVSQVGGRGGERFVSLDEQRQRIEVACERDGIILLDVLEEPDVSGGKPLDQRPGLSAAVAAIEAGKAEVVAAAYFDRLFRSLQTQAEVVSRVEAAGGQVLAVDVGQVTEASAGQWLSSTMMGAVSEYVRRSGKERSAEGQAMAVARGAKLSRHAPLGYRRRSDATLELDAELAPVVQEAFELRAAGASIESIRGTLKTRGVERTYAGVRSMLLNRTYLGEVHFGKMVNADAHEGIIDADLWARAQAVVVPRGPHGKSDHLLARLRVLRCASCGGTLSPATDNRDGYRVYRCPSTNPCTAHVTISARIVEGVVVDAVRARRADAKGRASIESGWRAAEVEAEVAQQALDRAIRTLAADADEPAAIDRLAELRADRDAARDRLAQLGPTHGATLTLAADRDWDDLSIDEQRAMIRATVHVVAVSRGRGLSKMVLGLYGDDAEAERILSEAARRVLSE
jgi:DNA invertase Pin-like site-specific DNA recombinase